MLPPDARAILRELLKPPIGSQLRQGVGTTFTVDLSAALSVPLSFAARDLGDTPDPIGVMEAVRSSADRIDIFYQGGQAAVPAQASDILAFLEPVLHPVKAPRRGHLFHPKVWVLTYIGRDGKTTTVSLLLSSRETKALNRNYFNTFVWRPALKRSGIPDERENGCHALRHFFASTALHEGETIKAVSEYLGHADPGFTLRTYTHLMEGSSERTKRAIDTVFGAAGATRGAEAPPAPDKEPE